VHPLAFAASGYQTCAAQIGKMPGDFWLVGVQNFYEKTNADFIVSDQVNDPQASSIRESFEQEFYAVLFAAHSVSFLCLLPAQ
jgi:hypothetical protein